MYQDMPRLYTVVILSTVSGIGRSTAHIMRYLVANVSASFVSVCLTFLASYSLERQFSIHQASSKTSIIKILLQRGNLFYNNIDRYNKFAVGLLWSHSQTPKQYKQSKLTSKQKL